MKKRKLRILKMYLSAAMVMLFTHCGEEEVSTTSGVNIPEGKGFETLSEYNFFEGQLAELTPNTEAGVLPYDLNMPLFSDYASKKRFIYVPSGSKIPYDTSKVLQLPIGSAVIKHFYYPESGTGTGQSIETRILLKKPSGWQPETYRWNEEQTEATRTVVGGAQDLQINVNGQEQVLNYAIPNQNQCISCHSYDDRVELIGPQVGNLNKEYAYADGTANQLETWMSKGILENTSVADSPKWPTMNPASANLTKRARAYLATNCSSCHRREGFASNSGLYLNYDNMDSLSLGFAKTPVAAGGGSGGLSSVIQPGAADESILLYRMISQEIDERMPEIGRELIHEEGVALIREWIDSLE